MVSWTWDCRIAETVFVFVMTHESIYFLLFSRTQMEGGVTPLLSSIEDAIEAIFLTAHKEDFSMEAETKQVEVMESIFITYHKEDFSMEAETKEIKVMESIFLTAHKEDFSTET